MKIYSIKFNPGGLFRRRSVSVELSNGNAYKIKRSGRYAVVVPPCEDGERDALGVVYKAAWEWLNKADTTAEGYTLDRGAKVACGRLVGLLDWPEGYTLDTEARLRYVVNKITLSENIF